MFLLDGGLYGETSRVVYVTSPEWCRNHQHTSRHAEQTFYKGKTVRVIVGFAAGGGFDAYARAIARNLGRHIPGNPAIIVENMTGAGSRIAANYLYKASPDGLIIGNFIGSLILQQIMGDKGIEFDARRFEWLGAPVQDETVCALTKASGINSLEDWFAAEKAGQARRRGSRRQRLRCTPEF